MIHLKEITAQSINIINSNGCQAELKTRHEVLLKILVKGSDLNIILEI